MTSPGKFSARAVEASWTKVDGDAVVYNPVTDKYVVLNPTAAFIWELLDGTNSPADLARALSDEYDVSPETALSDVEELLAVLFEKKLIRHR